MRMGFRLCCCRTMTLTAQHSTLTLSTHWISTFRVAMELMSSKLLYLQVSCLAVEAASCPVWCLAARRYATKFMKRSHLDEYALQAIYADDTRRQHFFIFWPVFAEPYDELPLRRASSSLIEKPKDPLASLKRSEGMWIIIQCLPYGAPQPLLGFHSFFFCCSQFYPQVPPGAVSLCRSIPFYTDSRGYSRNVMCACTHPGRMTAHRCNHLSTCLS